MRLIPGFFYRCGPRLGRGASRIYMSPVINVLQQPAWRRCLDWANVRITPRLIVSQYTEMDNHHLWWGTSKWMQDPILHQVLLISHSDTHLVLRSWAYVLTSENRKFHFLVKSFWHKNHSAIQLILGICGLIFGNKTLYFHVNKLMCCWEIPVCNESY